MAEEVPTHRGARAERWFGRCAQCLAHHLRLIWPAGQGWLHRWHEDLCGELASENVGCAGRVERLSQDVHDLCEATWITGGYDAVVMLLREFQSEVHFVVNLSLTMRDRDGLITYFGPKVRPWGV